MNSEARRSCHGWIVDLSFRTSRPEGERQGSIHGARKSQNRSILRALMSPDVCLPADSSEQRAAKE